MISWFKKIFGIKPKLFRHGDLLIRKVSSIPKTAILSSTNIIAYGEATGHHHKLQAKAGQAQVLVNKSQETQAFSVKNDTKLVHEEHKTDTIPKGYYKVEFEKEYEPLEQIERQVYD